jgi:hypothetical protein
MNNDKKESLSEKAFENTVEALATAQKLATENRDVEALVVISERWALFGQKIKDIDKGIKSVIGFHKEDFELESFNKEEDAEDE